MKTLEEMAEEWANQEVPQYHDICCTPTPMDCYAHKKAERGFLAGYKAAQQWISVKDRLPEMYEWVLIDGPEVCKRIEPPSSNWKEQYAWETNHDSFYSPNDVTHWMPLPEPPKEEK